MHVRPLRSAAVLAVGAVLALGNAPADASTSAHHRVAAKPQAAAKAAAWEASQLTRGRIHNGEFDVDDWGLTVDTGLALAAAGTQPQKLEAITGAVKNNYFDNYAAPGTERYAGSFAKTLLYADVVQQNVKNFGGHNLRQELLALVAPSGAGFEAGRVRDISDFGEFSNTFSQAYAVLGLARTGNVPAEVVAYLVKQQCDDGYFRLTEVPGETCEDSGSAPDVDATALAVQALIASSDQVKLPGNALDAARAYLVGAQRANGGFRGGTSTPSVNVNSTGLAAQALKALGANQAAAKAGEFVATMQFTKANTDGRAAKDIGAVAYNQLAKKNGLKNGIQIAERDQFRRATAQAIFAFVPKSLATLTATT